MTDNGNCWGLWKQDSAYLTGTGSGDLLSDDSPELTLAGGNGDDIYVVSSPTTNIIEHEGEGTDEVRTELDWRLGSWIENLTLTGTTDASGHGNELDNVLLGSVGDNVLFGLDGADRLEGGDGDDNLDGGNGDDTLIGGAGSDRLAGGAETDATVFDGLSSDYQITREEDEIWVVRGLERNVLSGVETLRFADREIAADQIVTGPVAIEDNATGVEDGAVTIRVLDNDLGQGIDVALAHDGAKGLVSVNDDGTVTYRPKADANGADNFTYTIRDANGLTSSTTVTLSIEAVNDAPVAVADSFTTTGRTALSGMVLGNDSDPEGDALTVSSYDQATAQGGTVSMADDGTFTYASADGFTGEDSFVYTLSDGNGGSSAATVTVTVGSESPAPAETESPDTGDATQIIDVTTATELMAALETAKGGETLRLAPGDYGMLNLNTSQGEAWAQYEAPVTLISADPGDRAVFTEFSLDGVANLTFDGILFDYDAAPGTGKGNTPFTISNARNVTVRNSIFDGDLAEGVNAIEDGYGTGKALRVGDSTGITIEGNEFFQWWKAASFGGSQDLVVRGNDIHSIRSDGLNFNTVQNVLVEQNHIHDFIHAPDSGDHADFIQIWTTSSSTAPTTDVVIRGNMLMRGAGDSAQGIFMRNGIVDKGLAGEEMYYRNVLIEDNVIWSAHTNGILVGETDGLTIRDNTLLHDAISGAEGGSPLIRVANDAENVTITRNIAEREPGTATGWNVNDNLVVQRDDPAQANYYADFFVNALNDGLGGQEDLQALPGGLVEQHGYGAAETVYDATPDALTALIRPEKLGGNSIEFDAGLTAAPDGPVSAEEAVFRWDFGDGTTGYGIEAQHTYDAPGDYVATLEVVHDGGSQDIARTLIDADAWF